MVENWIEINIDKVYEHDLTKTCEVNCKQKMKFKDNILTYVMNHMIRKLDKVKQSQIADLKRMAKNDNVDELETKIEKDIKYFDWDYECNKR